MFYNACYSDILIVDPALIWYSWDSDVPWEERSRVRTPDSTLASSTETSSLSWVAMSGEVPCSEPIVG